MQTYCFLFLDKLSLRFHVQNLGVLNLQER